VNSTEHPLRIDIWAEGRTLTAQVWGTLPDGWTGVIIDTDSETPVRDVERLLFMTHVCEALPER
jgi:hypothetical protein